MCIQKLKEEPSWKSFTHKSRRLMDMIEMIQGMTRNYSRSHPTTNFGVSIAEHSGFIPGLSIKPSGLIPGLSISISH